MINPVEQFQKLHQGRTDAYGIYDPTTDEYETKKTSLTSEHYKQHLEGKISLGVIPITPDGKCSVGIIDDDYQHKNKTYDYNQELIHPVIAEKIHHLLKLTQDAAHNEGHNLRVDTYLSSSSSNYLYLSLIYSLLEVLDYIKPYLDENPDKDINIQKWSLKKAPSNSTREITGTIIRVADNGYGSFESNQLTTSIGVMPSFMRQHRLESGSEIKITTKPSPCGTKTYVDEFIEKLN